MDSFDDRGYHWAEITNTTDTINSQRVFIRGARIDVPGSKIAQLADEMEAAGDKVAADRVRRLFT